MTDAGITQQRLQNQRLAGSKPESAAEVVRWLGAVQAQDYGAAKWALGLRLDGASEAAIDAAFADGSILRTHVLRPTWHFVLPEDIRWMLALTAPHVNALSAYYFRKLELDDAIFARSSAALIKALEGGRQITRDEAADVLEQAGIDTKDLLRLGYLLIRAELDAVICSGARRGKQMTYALLDERAPQKRTLSRDEALALLAERYFQSHAPATVKDYSWWSGLSAADAKAGLEMIKARLSCEEIDGETYWFAPSVSEAAADNAQVAYLLPNYDESIVAYTDRSAVIDPTLVRNLDARGNVLFNHTLLIDGEILGTWKRTLKRNEVVIEISPFIPLSEAQSQAVSEAAQRYGEFVGLAVVLL